MPRGQPSGNRSPLFVGYTIDSRIALFASSSPMTSFQLTLGFSFITKSSKSALSVSTFPLDLAEADVFMERVLEEEIVERLLPCPFGGSNLILFIWVGANFSSSCRPCDIWRALILFSYTRALRICP